MISLSRGNQNECDYLHCPSVFWPDGLHSVSGVWRRLSRTFVCSSCGMYDFDALFDLRFRNRLCCEYIFVEDEQPVHSRQTIFARKGNRSIVLMDSVGNHLWWRDVGSKDWGEHVRFYFTFNPNHLRRSPSVADHGRGDIPQSVYRARGLGIGTIRRGWREAKNNRLRIIGRD